MPGRPLLAFSVLALLCVSCSRGCSAPDGPAPSASASAPLATASAKPTPPPPPPPKTPVLPPQWVACDGLDFYRITENSLHVFQASARVPPLQLRGSATASHSARIEVGAPENVIVLGDGSVLVAGEKNFFRFAKGTKEAQPSAPDPAGRGRFLWRDGKRTDSFWVRSLGDKELRRYTWPAGEASEPAKLNHDREPLPDFDGRLFAVLGDGVPVYSTTRGLDRPGHDTRTAPATPLSKPGTSLFADASPDHYWTADPRGDVGLWQLESPEAPLLDDRVPGVFVDAAVEGDRVAVLSMELKNQAYQPSITVWSKGKRAGQLSIGPSAAHMGQPPLDLCLIQGRPWVVVGGPQWLQLLDFTGPRLLAEW